MYVKKITNILGVLERLSKVEKNQENYIRDKGNQMKNCKHHWKVEPPRGHVSKGVCKKCKATKDFYNSDPRDRKIPRHNKKTGTTVLTPDVYVSQTASRRYFARSNR